MDTSFQLGDVTIHRIVEQQSLSGHALEFLPNLTPETLAENRSWLQQAGALSANDQIILCFQSYVIRTPHHVVLVDTCYGNEKTLPRRPAWHMSTDGTYMRNLAALGLTVDDIDVVMCTHLHADHVGWNTRREDGRWVPTFPRARYLFTAEELAFWTARHAEEPLPHFVESVLPIVAANRADLITSSHEFGDHIRLLPTPGHTPDHFAVRIGRTRDEAVVTGDLLHSPLQMRHPDLAMRLDIDPQQSATTRRSFLERYAGTSTLCCTAHFPAPSVGRITNWGTGFRCEPVSPLTLAPTP
jgi:glyoxylase-like metal-dependent hydrolase (beta-lactamase superfamily II)